VRASLLILVALPHTALAVAVFYLFAFVIRAHLGSVAQSVAHVTVALPFVSLIVWTRVVLLDASYEEQAADLGASPLSTIRRVLLHCVRRPWSSRRPSRSPFRSTKSH